MTMILTGLLGFFISISAHSQAISFEAGNAVARVTKIIGKAKLEHIVEGKKDKDGKPIVRKTMLKRGDYIQENDRVQTGVDSYIRILTRDDSVIQLGQVSDLIFTKFSGSDSSNYEISYRLKYGALRALFTKKHKKDRTFIAGALSGVIKATDLAIEVFYEGLNLETEVALLRGEMELELKDLNLDLELEDRTQFTLQGGEIFSSLAARLGKEGFKNSVTKLSQTQFKDLDLGRRYFYSEVQSTTYRNASQITSSATGIQKRLKPSRVELEEEQEQIQSFVDDDLLLPSKAALQDMKRKNIEKRRDLLQRERETLVDGIKSN